MEDSQHREDNLNDLAKGSLRRLVKLSKRKITWKTGREKLAMLMTY